jgi:hypothetical protein
MIPAGFLPCLLLKRFEHPSGATVWNLYDVTPLLSWCYRRHFTGSWQEAKDESERESRLSNLPLFHSVDGSGNELLLFDPRDPRKKGA